MSFSKISSSLARDAPNILASLSSNLATRATIIPLDGFNPSRAVVYPSG